MRQQCESCQYWRENYKYGPAIHFGDCRRHSPVIVTPAPLGSMSTHWPVTQNNDICGDWKAKP